jgi:lipopolysaccharide cholinephosphotransferase
MTEAQKRMYEILCEFDRFAQDNDLVYWIDHGTLLGAVRHQGFIPWDDDLDISMPREDYEKLLLLKEKLPEWIFFQNKTTDKKVHIHYIKLRDKNSLYIEKWEASKNIKYHQGIFIDIFPVNCIKKNLGSKYKFLVNVSKIFSNRYFRWDFVSGFFIKLINAFHAQDSDYCVSGAEQMHYIVHIEKEYVFPLRELKFEDRNFPVPSDYHEYLKKIFGNYMQLPPQHKRKMHACKVKVY